MKVIYRIYSDWDLARVGFLASHGIKVAPGFGSFEIEETGYLKLKDQLDKWNVDISYGTLYEEDEISNSSYLLYAGSWANGYPQPESNFGYIGTTYDDKHYCRTCGTGAVQQSAFRLKKRPNWGSKKVFNLNWVFDELFVRKDLYEEVFKKYNLENRPVLLFKKESVIEDTVQLSIPKITVRLNLDTQPFEVCQTCNRKKYNPQIKGFFPSFKEELNSDWAMFKSEEYFGSGASAHNKIFITQALRQDLLKHGVKIQFVPVNSSN